jgi:hypothetical protein
LFGEILLQALLPKFYMSLKVDRQLFVLQDGEEAYLQTYSSDEEDAEVDSNEYI